MSKLGHPRCAVVGHDTGYIIGDALAADHRAQVDRLAVAEIPGPPRRARRPECDLDRLGMVTVDAVGRVLGL